MNLNQWFVKYDFNLKSNALIEQAFYHSSYIHEHKNLNLEDNQRLEFMGDAVLQLWSANYLYHLEQKYDEGIMTLMRSSIVCEDALSSYALNLELNQFLKLGVGEIKSQGYLRKSLLADMFEAFVGAIYLSSSFDNIDKLCNLTLVPKVNELSQDMIIDYKTKLQEYIQSDIRKTVTYEVINTSGSANQPVFESVVKLDNLILGQGQGHSKKKSQQAAAKNALEKLAK